MSIDSFESNLNRVRIVDHSADGNGLSFDAAFERIENMRLMGAEARARGFPVTACPNFSDDALTVAWRDGWRGDEGI